METRAAKRRRLLYTNRWSVREPEWPVYTGADEGPRFPLFGQLPAELRLEIWRLIEEQARPPLHPLRVRLWPAFQTLPAAAEDDRTRGRKKRKPPAAQLWSVPRLRPMPDLAPATHARRALLRVCREARHEYLRRWSATLDLDGGGLVRFDAARDLVYLDMDSCSLLVDDLALLRAAHPAALPPFARAIRHIGFEMIPRRPQWKQAARDAAMPRPDFLLCFPALRSVSLVNYGCFAREVAWALPDEARLLLARSAGHCVSFRSFAALPDAAYADHAGPAAAWNDGRCFLGGPAANNHPRHDCAICSIHRCVSMREMLRNSARLPPPDATTTTSSSSGSGSTPPFTDAERRWLGSLKFHTLLAAATPDVERHVQPLDPASLETGSDKVPAAGSGSDADTGNAAALDSGAFDDDSDDDAEEDDLLWDDSDGDLGFDELVAVIGPHAEQFL